MSWFIVKALSVLSHVPVSQWRKIMLEAGRLYCFLEFELAMFAIKGF